MTIKISGTGSALPEKRLTNKELEQMVDTSDAWIRERTGIQERHIAEGDSVVSLAAKACQRALADAGRTAEEVDLILLATCSAEMLLPCSAAQVQGELGAVNAVAFDINAACAGFLFALQTARAYITGGMYQNALVIGAEVLSKIVDWEDRGTCVLFGDGAGAVFVEKSEEEDRGILSMVQGSDGSRGGVLYCRTRPQETEDAFAGRDAFVHMNGGEVYKFAVRQVPDCIENALKKAGLTVADIDLFVLHQANVRIIEAIAKRLRAGMEHFPVNADRVGNTSSAAIPLLLDELRKSGKIQVGQRLVLSGFGAGLTYGACVMRW
ncbi:MAG: ketoacyl-ACP synthase III [Lachnospiraceae bacterium]|nr:ketoacyl-ACP synthase III [Lachnospiraceae bacterium]